MLRPIPKKLLPDTATVRVCNPDQDAYDGRGSFSDPVTIKGVRWEAREMVKASQHVFTDGSTGLMFVDRINSAGAFEIPAGSLVTVNGQEKFVVQTFPVKEMNGVVHHWEVELR